MRKAHPALLFYQSNIATAESADGGYSAKNLYNLNLTGCFRGLLRFSILAFCCLIFSTAEAFTVTGVSVSSSQAGTLTYGTAGSVTYTITLNMTGTIGGSTNFSLNWTTPSGVTFSPASEVLTGDGQTVTLTLNTTSTTPAGNYSFTVTSSDGPATSAAAGFVVDAKPLTITAQGINKIYGNLLSNVSGSTAFTPAGLQNGDAVGSISVAYGTGAAANAAVGTYTGSVTPSAATGGTFDPANYIITYVPGNIIVNPAPLTITADNVTKPYGTGLAGAAGSTAFTHSALQNGETIGSVTIGYGVGAATNAVAGSYPGSVVPSAATGGSFNPLNYAISYIAGDITVTNANATIVVSSNLSPACTGSSVTLEATITTVIPNATGTVEFFDGATSLGTAAVASNQAAITTTTLAVGIRSITAVYSGDANYSGSTSAAISQEIKSNPTTAIAGPDQTGAATCGLTTITLAANSPASGTGSWSVATGTGGSFSNASLPNSTFTGIAGNSYTLRWTVSNAPCLASTSDMLVALNAIPSVTPQVMPQILCNNGTTTAINFTGTATTYSWTNDQPSIGLAASGAGNIASFAAVNTGAASITATINVTPLANGCTGIPQPYLITVKPQPVVTANPSTQTICSGGSLTTINLTSNVGGTINWSRDNEPGITGSGGVAGFGAAGSTINGSFVSTLTAPGTVVFHATATFNGCISASPTDFSVTVNPVATVNAVSDLTVCRSSTPNTGNINFSSSVATSYTWTNSNTTIGLAASGSGNIASFAALNGGTAPNSGTITVTPVYTGGITCPGTPGTFTITVNPALALTSTATPPAVCSGTVFNYTPTTTSSVVTPSFTWTRAAVAGISNPPVTNGSGDISEALVNTTFSTVNVTYVYTVWATHNSVSCANPTTFNVVVPVNPKPRVRADYIPTGPAGTQNICTGSAITPVSITQHASSSAVTINQFGWVRQGNTSVITFPTSGTSASPPLIISGTFTSSATNVRTTTFKIFGVSNQGCTSDSVSFVVNVSPVILNNTIQGSHVSQVAICGLLKQVTIATPPPTGGNGTYTYQWQESLDGGVTFSNVLPANVINGTLPTLIYQGADALSNYYFRRIAYSGGCSDISPSYHVGPVSGAAPSYIVGACTGSSGMDVWVIASYAGASYQLQKYNGATWDNVYSALVGDGDSLHLKTDIQVLGTYRVVASLPGPPACNVIVDSIVTIGPNTLPTRDSIVTSANPTPVCSGNSVNLFANYLSAPAGSNPGVTWYTVSSGGAGSGVVLVGDPYAVIPPTPVNNPDTIVSYYAKAIYTTSGCKSNLRKAVAITVNKTPVMTSADSVGICSGSPVNLSFTNNYGAGVTYEWKALADNPNITGESLTPVTNGVLTNTLTNTSNTTQTVQYSVTPRVTSTGCTGIPDTVKVTVDPRPVITSQSAIVCSGNRFTISPVNGGGNTIPVSPVTQYTWSVPTGTGFTGGMAGSGTSITDSLINTTTGPVTASYSVVASGGACSGISFTANVTINPTPAITNQAVYVCNGSFSIPPFTGTNIVPAGTTYTWPTPTGSNISGLASSGGPQSTIFGTLVNTSFPRVPKTATYTVTPTGPAGLGGCIGKNFTVAATINPIPSATIAGTTTVCQNAPSPNITFTGANGTAPYSFTYNLFDGVTNTVGTSAGSISVATTTPGTYTYSLLTVTDNSSSGCPEIQGGSAIVTVRPLPFIGDYAVNPCSGTLFSVTPVNGSPTLATIVPAGTTYSWPIPTLPAGVTGASAGTAQPGFSQTLINNTAIVKYITYTVTPSSATCPGSPFTVSVTLDPAVPANTAIWTGLTSVDWCNPGNWACGIIPDINKNAVIPTGTPNQPSIEGTCNATVKDLDLQGTATLNLDAGRGLTVYGEFITTTNPNRFTLNGLVTFAGGNQQIPGFTYTGLSVTGGGLKTLTGDALVNGSLNLINGIIVSSITNMLTTGVSAVVSAGWDQSYIQGPLTRFTNSTSTYTFPVGGNGQIRNAYVIPETNTLSSYTAYYYNTSPTINLVLDVNLTGVQTNEHWDIIRNSGSDAVVGMDYVNPNGLAAGAPTTDWSSGVNPCGLCNVAVVDDDASNNWYFTGSGTGFGPNEATYWQSNNPVYSRQLLGNFGQFTFGYAYSVILPVTLLDFTGTLQQNNALLKWNFATGNDLSGTEVQHSTDGRHFSKLSAIDVNQNTSAYSYVHANLQPGAHYYRLLIKDKAGKVFYSKSVLLVAGRDITLIKGIRPTMVHSETYVDIHAAKSQTVNATLYDVAGRRAGEYRSSLQQGENSFRINTSMLAKGLYTLHVQTTDGVMANLRFIKE